MTCRFSRMVKEQTGNGSTRDKNWLGHFPAKQNGKA